MKNIITILSLFMLFFTACDPQEDDKIDIGLPPSNVSFVIEESGEPNTYTFRNTTDGAFLYLWDFGQGSTSNDEVAEVLFPTKGEFEISLTIFTSGGSASGTQVLVVPEDAPVNCENEPALKFISNCDQKTWKLSASPGSLWVGPADYSATWWEIGQEDIDARPCAFNDEWIFTEDGQMIYDTKGDMWGEDYMGFDFECIDEGQLGGNQAAWASGTHTYAVLPGTPPKLMVSGLGAYIGLPKAANGAEVNEPQQGVTYNITKMETTPDGDLLEIEVNMGAGVWRFRLTSEN